MGDNPSLEIYSARADLLQTCKKFSKPELDFPFPNLDQVRACHINKY